MNGRWTLLLDGNGEDVIGILTQGAHGLPGDVLVPVVPCDDAAVERGARALWSLYCETVPGHGRGMEPPWGDRESGQTAEFYQQAEAVLRAARETT